MSVPKAAHFDVEVDGRPLGRLNFLLYPNTPRTSTNFGTLTEGYTPRYPVSNRSKSQTFRQLCYRDTSFHRIIPGFMIQGGDTTDSKIAPTTGRVYPGSYPGTGGQSIYGEKFPDENFLNKHEVGSLSMANSGRNTNGSQFFICTSPCQHLDEKHVVFGRLADQESMRVAKKMESYGSRSGEPSAIIKVADAGVTAYWTEQELSNTRSKSFNSRVPM